LYHKFFESRQPKGFLLSNTGSVLGQHGWGGDHPTPLQIAELEGYTAIAPHPTHLGRISDTSPAFIRMGILPLAK